MNLPVVSSVIACGQKTRLAGSGNSKTPLTVRFSFCPSEEMKTDVVNTVNNAILFKNPLFLASYLGQNFNWHVIVIDEKSKAIRGVIIGPPRSQSDPSTTPAPKTPQTYKNGNYRIYADIDKAGAKDLKEMLKEFKGALKGDPAEVEALFNKLAPKKDTTSHHEDFLRRFEDRELAKRRLHGK